MYKLSNMKYIYVFIVIHFPGFLHVTTVVILVFCVMFLYRIVTCTVCGVGLPGFCSPRSECTVKRPCAFFRRILVYYLVVGVVWMCVGDGIVFGFGVAKHRECDDVSSKNTVKKAEMCRPC